MEKKYDVFISYSRKDYLREDEKTPAPDKIVTKILTVLDAHNISYWIDKQGLYSSAQFAAVIEEQISNARCFLFVSTLASNTSKYTLGEVFTAVEYEKPIIPFRADDSKFGKGIGFHLRPLDHIEYFKTGEEAFIKLVNSIKHIKAEQLQDQLSAEYMAIVEEYKTKLRIKSDEMRANGLIPPSESLIDDDTIKRIKGEYKKKLETLQVQKEELANKVLELSSTIARIQEAAAEAKKKMECEIMDLKKGNKSLTEDNCYINNQLAAKEKEFYTHKTLLEKEKKELEAQLNFTKMKLDEVSAKLKKYQDKEFNQSKSTTNPGNILHVESNAGINVTTLHEIAKFTKNDIEKDQSDGFVVGKIQSCIGNRVFTVDIGKAKLQIVSTAIGLSQGDLVIVACVGTFMPLRYYVEECEIWGNKSQGVICTEDDLKISKEYKAVILSSNYKVGDKVDVKSIKKSYIK